MRSISALEVLGAWERGLDQPLVERALGMLSALYPEEPWERLAALPIGQRDEELFALRERLFGPEMACVEVCPQCGGRLDLMLNAAEIRAAYASEPKSELTVSVAGYKLQFRPANSSDLVEALEWNRDNQDPGEARNRLLARCLLTVEHEAAAEASEQLPEEVMNAVAERMASADPLADVQLAVSCPVCSHRWRASFDIVSFLWREIESLAARLLRDVHTLAAAYGWHEQEILTLSPVRRQFYLAMLEA